MEKELFKKYHLEDLFDNTWTVEKYSEKLFFADCVRILVQTLRKDADFDQAFSKWISEVFWGTKGNTHSEFKDKLRHHLEYRNFIYGHSLTAIDVIVISFMWSTEDELIKELLTRFEVFGQVKYSLNESKKISEKEYYSNLRWFGPSCMELVDAFYWGDMQLARELLEENPLRVSSQV